MVYWPSDEGESIVLESIGGERKGVMFGKKRWRERNIAISPAKQGSTRRFACRNARTPVAAPKLPLNWPACVRFSPLATNGGGDREAITAREFRLDDAHVRVTCGG